MTNTEIWYKKVDIFKVKLNINHTNITQTYKIIYHKAYYNKLICERIPTILQELSYTWKL